MSLPEQSTTDVAEADALVPSMIAPAATQPKVLAQLENVSVHFPIYGKGGRSLKKTLLEVATGGRIREAENSRVVVEALSQVNLSLAEGDRLALIGHNGAGKTTMLRVLAGVYEPSYGRIEVQGKISALFDITLGMEPDATGRENIMLRGLLFGMSPKEIEERTPGIEEFSGLGDYLDMPLRTYSSGMNLRLAFSIATCVQPDILLMDEWISTGDAEFINRAQKRLAEIVDASRVLVLASHNHELLKRWCNRYIRMEHGRVVASGRMEDLDSEG